MTVLMPFIMSRCVVFVVFFLTQISRDAPITPDALARLWDGGWFISIANGWYLYRADTGQSPLPFFPLFPSFIWAISRSGIPLSWAGLAVSNLAFLISMELLSELARPYLKPDQKRLALWLIAFFPGSAPLSFCYSDSMFLALSAGALLLQQRGNQHAAGIAAAGATLARPNGIIAGLVLAMDFTSKKRRFSLALFLPSAVVLAAWSAYLWLISGSPISWIQEKRGWEDITILDSLLGIFRGYFEGIIYSILGIWLIILCYRSMKFFPGSWGAFGILAMLPSLLAGVVGMPRYGMGGFSAFFFLARQIKTRAASAFLLGLSAVSLAIFTFLTVSWRLTP